MYKSYFMTGAGGGIGTCSGNTMLREVDIIALWNQIPTRFILSHPIPYGKLVKNQDFIGCACDPFTHKSHGSLTTIKKKLNSIQKQSSKELPIHKL